MKKRTFLALVALLMVPGAVGQEAGWLEPFTGSLTEEFYTHSTVAGEYAVSGNVYLGQADQGNNGEVFTLDNPLEATADWDVSFDLTVFRPTAPDDSEQSVGIEGLSLVAGLTVLWDSSADEIITAFNCGASFSGVITLVNSPTQDEYTFTFIVIHSSNGDIECTIDGNTDSDTGVAADGNVFRFNERSDDGGLVAIDNLFVNDGIGTHTITQESTSSEFDTGLQAFLTGVGFVSSESELLFALIAVGLATVLTAQASVWVSPGRFKNYVVMAAGALVGVFCIVLAFLDLWMYVVALMLGIFAVRGGKEARNTWFEIKEKIAERRAPATDPVFEAAVRAAEFQANEEAIQEAIQEEADAS